MLVTLILGGITVSAETEIVKVTGRYGQTEARSMFGMINDFRTGSDAWYWNESNTEKIYETGLEPLTYDYQLEEAAMLRAMEIAVYYDHARPNMKGYASDLVSSGYGGWHAFAENIAVGYSTTAAAFEGWQETNEYYDGQGHRRSMLSSEVTAVGIGHVYYNGCHYWVQLFRDLVGSTSETPANDSETTVEIEVDSSVITNKSAEPSVNSIELPYGGSAELPKITGGIQTTEAWPGRICPIELPYEWKSADTEENYIKLDGGKGTIEAVGIGTTEITTTVMGTVITVPVTVVRIPIDSAQVVLEQDSYTYSGEKFEPAPTLTLDGTVLTAETDYTVTYENNIDAGTAVVTITGTGNYEGTITKEFEIAAKELGSESSVTMEQTSLVYTGSEIKPEVTVVCGEKELDPETDYEIKYSNNENAGQASVTITAKGNYKGGLTETFTILPLKLEDCTVDEIADQTYTGAEIRPSVAVKNGELLLDKSDYTVEYDSNTDVGNASAKITGQKNCEGELTVAFQILPLNLQDCTADKIADQTYTGAEIRPSVTVKNGEISLDKSNYTVEYEDNTDAGKASVKVTGQKNCEGELTVVFQILPLDLKEGNCIIDEISQQEYAGNPVKPDVTVRHGEKVLVKGSDYSVKYSGNEGPGTAVVTVTGKGNYAGTITQNFVIRKAPEETERNPSGGDTQEPEETEKNPSGGDTQKPEETEKNPSGGDTQKPGETEKNPSGGDTQKPEETEKNPSGGDTQEPGETEKNPSGGDTQKPGETEKNPSGGDTQKPGETEEDPSGGETEEPSVKPGFEIGSRKEDLATGAVYTVTGSNASGLPTVEYTMPINTGKTTVNIPAAVVIENVKCKVTAIANNAFKNNGKLKKVIIGKNVSVIGSNAFRNCLKLSSVTMGTGVATIKAGAFYNCISLREITLPAKVSTIGKQAFYGCKKLARITIKTKKLTVKSVGNNAFGNLYAKTAVKVPKNKLKEYKKLLKGKGLGAKSKIS